MFGFGGIASQSQFSAKDRCANLLCLVSPQIQIHTHVHTHSLFDFLLVYFKQGGVERWGGHMTL